jgi:iron complex transport system ATP-binding protein
MLRAEALALAYPGRLLLEELTLEFHPGQMWAVLGRNGSGKSTLLRALAGLHRAQGGAVRVDGRPLEDLPRREVALRIGVLLQEETREFWGSVRDYVLLGRYPHAHGLFGWSAQDEMVAQSEMATLHLLSMADRPYATLSGGERQRARAAALFAQRSPVVLLDEPLQHLDLAHQVAVLERLQQDARSRGTVVVLVLHDLLLASRYCDHFLLLHGDGRSSHGAGGEILSADRLSDLYGAALDEIQVGGELLFLPRRPSTGMPHV